MKKFLSTFSIALLCVFLMNQSANSVELKDVKSLKPPAYRIGTSEETEEPYTLVESIDTDSVKVVEPLVDVENLTYADLGIKRISAELSKELDMDYDMMYADLSMLWQGAATNSDIIKFAVYKLSNPDADKPDKNSVKKVLGSIASMSTLIGAGIGNPIFATGSFLGSDIMGIMSQDDKAMNYKYTKVNDADMIILVRKVDELQQRVVDAYYDYITNKKMLEMTTKMAEKRHMNYELAQNSSKEIILIADAYYRTALDMKMKARSDFFTTRATMEQLVGNQIFTQFESVMNSRD